MALDRKFFLALFLFLLVSAAMPALAIVDEGGMKIFAVTTEGTGLSADLHLTLAPGNGRVWIAVTPLVGTTTQSAERTAVEVAKKYSSGAGKYDYFFDINSNASVVEGPSAGAAMTLLAISLLKDKRVPVDVSMTGTINSDGSVGAVGGVFEKAKEASRQGIKLFMIPKGEAKQTVKLESGVQSINLVDYAPGEWGMKVAEVSNIDEAFTYAFSDITQIDVNSSSSNGLPDFVPNPIETGKSLEPMKELTTSYVEDSKILVEQARLSLSTTLIEDSGLISELLQVLNNAQETVKEAELLNEQNYLYSSANYAFLARVDAMTVKDVSDNPSLLALNSTVFSTKIENLKEELLDFKKEFSKNIPIDYFEYYVSAQQRLKYAELNISKLESTQVVVVGGDEMSSALQNLQDLEFAAAWLEISKDLYRLSQKQGRKILPDDSFSSYMNDYIIKAEDGLAVSAGEERDDIQRRLDAAKDAKKDKWFLSSSFDAASAFALISADNASKGLDLNESFSLLESKVNGLEGKISSSPYPFVWPQLYLDHAKYFLEAARFYDNQGQGVNASNALKSGIGLAFLAEELFNVSSDFSGHYSKVKPEELLPEDSIPIIPGIGGGGALTATQFALMLALIAVLVAVIVLLTVLLLRKRIHVSAAKHSESLKSEMHELDLMRAEMIEFGHGLRNLKKSVKKGAVSEKEFHEKLNGFIERLSKADEKSAGYDSGKKFAFSASAGTLPSRASASLPVARAEKNRADSLIEKEKAFEKAQKKKPAKEKAAKEKPSKWPKKSGK
ncbi:MAG: S16 family serine protease [Candidatus Diapherotrites archaeon]